VGLTLDSKNANMDGADAPLRALGRRAKSAWMKGSYLSKPARADAARLWSLAGGAQRAGTGPVVPS